MGEREVYGGRVLRGEGVGRYDISERNISNYEMKIT